MAKEVFEAGMKLPKEVDDFSAPPKGFKHHIDDSKGGTEWMKKVVTANFPVEDLQIFHEEKSDVGGKMIARFHYKWSRVELPISYQDKLNTLTPQTFEELAPHIQSMSQDTRGLFNVIINHINKIEQRRKAIQNNIRK